MHIPIKNHHRTPENPARRNNLASQRIHHNSTLLRTQIRNPHITLAVIHIQRKRIHIQNSIIHNIRRTNPHTHTRIHTIPNGTGQIQQTSHSIIKLRRTRIQQQQHKPLPITIRQNTRTLVILRTDNKIPHQNTTRTQHKRMTKNQRKSTVGKNNVTLANTRSAVRRNSTQQNTPQKPAPVLTLTAAKTLNRRIRHNLTQTPGQTHLQPLLILSLALRIARMRNINPRQLHTVPSVKNNIANLAAHSANQTNCFSHNITKFKKKQKKDRQTKNAPARSLDKNAVQKYKKKTKHQKKNTKINKN